MLGESLRAKHRTRKTIYCGIYSIDTQRADDGIKFSIFIVFLYVEYLALTHQNQAMNLNQCTAVSVTSLQVPCWTCFSAAPIGALCKSTLESNTSTYMLPIIISVPPARTGGDFHILYHLCVCFVPSVYRDIFPRWFYWRNGYADNVITQLYGTRSTVSQNTVYHLKTVRISFFKGARHQHHHPSNLSRQAFISSTGNCAIRPKKTDIA